MIRYTAPALVLAALLLNGTAQAQVCPKNVKLTTPDSRYELLNEGSEVLDHKTKLVWQRCSLGQVWDGSTCSGTASHYTWQQAMEAAKVATGGWTLPDSHALRTLVERGCNNPAINVTMFPNTPNAGFWSSSSAKNRSTHAWNMYFSYGNGYFDKKNDHYAVRLVRAQQEK
ncbi:MAG: DUF1566 domain-containing protein [Fluviicoccus sp.]|uniref:Lcl C-terminal domain-containing protein n=1 Tax=Fluviicoccus sp. TaxID=2003552 RepID=UPI00271D7935|nr:DUF1566 domain-containing protein [Fluviicoccus sp.]MDO8329843.1 DUF1566 domain-containing protein [Fluviicoccus sp.]